MSEAPKKFPKPDEGLQCWIEIPAKDLDKLQQFYTDVFPNWVWPKSETTDGVRSFHTGSKTEMGGGLTKMPEGAANTDGQQMAGGMTVYFWVDSIEEATAHIEKLGGKTVMPKTEQGESGWFANLVDIEGNRFGIYQLRPHLLE